MTLAGTLAHACNEGVSKKVLNLIKDSWDFGLTREDISPELRYIMDMPKDERNSEMAWFISHAGTKFTEDQIDFISLHDFKA